MHLIKVSINKQTMCLYKNQDLMQTYSISTAKKGAGEVMGSEQTPRGLHQVRAKIGANCLENTVFIERRPTGEIFSQTLLMQQAVPRDWILTRILWLSGLEPGKNRFGKVDTMRRYIYIHGSPDSVEMGKPGSRGCIRMHNKDIIDLFNTVKVGDRVLIESE